jgi:hypothetical protein
LRDVREALEWAASKAQRADVVVAAVFEEVTAMRINEGKLARITSAAYVDEHNVRVRFDNGKAFTVNLREPVYRLKGLRAVRHTKAFSRVAVGPDGYSLAWPGDLDIGADTLWQMALEQHGRADAVEFIRWRRNHSLSLTAAAEALGLSRRQVAYYASGEHEVPRTVLLACKGWEAERQAAA